MRIRTVVVATLVSLTGRSLWADPFSTLADTISQAGSRWAPALMVLGALCAGGAIVMGSHESGKWAKNFLIGSIFLILAGAGAAILGKVQGLIGSGF
jgi:hypothetical protein